MLKTMRKLNKSKIDLLALAVVPFLLLSCSSSRVDRDSQTAYLPSDTATIPAEIEDYEKYSDKSEYVAESLDDSSSLLDDDSDGSAIVPGSLTEDYVSNLKSSETSAHVFDSTDTIDNVELTDQEKLAQSAIRASGSIEGDDTSYVSGEVSDILGKTSNLGNQNFTFLFYRDDYTYKSLNNSFDNTYRFDGGGNTKASDFSGIFRVSGHLMHQWRFMTVGWGFGGGFGYNGGYGFFDRSVTAEEQSQTHFALWTIPVDMSFMIEIEPFSWIKLTGLAGPSAMVIIQSRDDFEKSNARKTMTQYSPGYFVSARGNISLSYFFKDITSELFHTYSITRYFLTLEGRMQNYSNFKSTDVSVSGLSFGAGLTFEYF